MTPGQTRVTVLLIFLLVLEIVAHTAVKDWFKNFWYQFQTGLNQASGGKQ